MTRSTGTKGSITPGFLFNRTTADRIAARSTSNGTPVKSCSSTRATTKGTSSVRSAVGCQLAIARTSSSVILLPSKFLSTDSRTMRMLTGKREILPMPSFSSCGNE
jgi:hypothetical protein